MKIEKGTAVDTNAAEVSKTTAVRDPQNPTNQSGRSCMLFDVVRPNRARASKFAEFDVPKQVRGAACDAPKEVRGRTSFGARCRPQEGGRLVGRAPQQLMQPD